LFLFLPLIDLDVAPQPDRGFRDIKKRIFERVGSGGVAGHMDELGIISGINVVGRHIDDGGGAFTQAFGGRHSATFIPKKKDDRAHDEDKTEKHSHERLSDSAKNGLTGYFGNYV